MNHTVPGTVLPVVYVVVAGERNLCMQQFFMVLLCNQASMYICIPCFDVDYLLQCRAMTTWYYYLCSVPHQTLRQSNVTNDLIGRYFTVFKQRCFT